MTQTKRKQKESALTQIMAEPIHFPGFWNGLITTRGFAYQWLKGRGWDESERGYGSLDYAIFAAHVAQEPLTDEPTRDRLLSQVSDEYARTEAAV